MACASNQSSTPSDERQPYQIAARTLVGSALSTFYIDTNGCLWAWGEFSNTPLHIKTSVASVYPLQSGFDGNRQPTLIYVIRRDDSLWQLSGSHFTEHTHIMDSVASFCVSGIIICIDNNLWDFPANFHGRHTPDHIMDNVIFAQFRNDRSPHRLAMFIIRTDNSLWATDENSMRQLGYGTQTNRSELVHIMDNAVSVYTSTSGSIFAIQTDGSLWSWGVSARTGEDTHYVNPTPTLIMNNVASLYISQLLGDSTFFAIKTDNSLWGWNTGYLKESFWEQEFCSVAGEMVYVYMHGYTSDSMLGNGIGKLHPYPVHIMDDIASIYTFGRQNRFALGTDGTLWSWGVNTAGIFGIGTQGDIHLTPTRVLYSVENFSLSTARRNTANLTATAILYNGNILVWGYNENGTLGDGTNTTRLSPHNITYRFN